MLLPVVSPQRWRVLLPLLAAGAAFAATTAEARVNPYFAPEDDLKAITLGEIEAAKYRIDATLPDLQDEPLVAALIDLAKAGKQVRVVTSSSYVLGDDGKCKPCDLLELAGADVRHVEPKILQRILIVDGPRSRSASGVLGRILTSTGPFTAPKKGQSLLSYVREGDFTLSFQDEFNFVWGKARDHDDKARLARVYNVRVPHAPFATFSSGNMAPVEIDGQFVFNPAASVRTGLLTDTMIQAVNQAYDRVEIATRSLASPTLAAALGRAMARGVRVKVLLPQSQWNPRWEDEMKSNADKLALLDERLALRGAEVAYVGSGLSGTTFLVDRKLALVGSTDLRAGRELRGFTHFVSLRGEPVAAFAKKIDDGFAAGLKSPALEKKKQGLNVKAAAVQRPLSRCRGLIPVSYSFDEMQKMRAALMRGDCR